MKFFALIPFATFILGALAVHSWCCRRYKSPMSFRESLLIAAVMLGVWTVFGTELLGFFKALAFRPVSLLWVVPIIVAAAELFRHPKSFSLSKLFSVKFPAGQAWLCWLLIILSGVILALALFTALLAPQNNPDALAYHLPRIVFWRQQHSLADFPTSTPFQLFMPPLTEYLGLNVMILGQDSDWALNLIPFGCLVLLAAAASEAVEFFQADVAAQLLAALFMLSIPTAFVFATAFKPELLLCLWVIILSLWLMRVAVVRRCNFHRLFLITAAFGLLPFTGGVGYIYAFPLAILAIVAFVRVFHWRAAGALALTAVIVILISAPFYLRNMHQFGSPLGPVNSPDPHSQFINAVITPKSILTNLLRNTGPMFAGPIDQVNQAVDRIINGIARKCSLNMQDPRLTFPGPIGSTSYDGVHYFPGNENRITWPFQMFLFLVTPIGLWLMRKEPLNAARWWWLALPAGILLIFSALLRWHPAEAHLLLAIPVLLVPPAALAVAAFRPIFLRGVLALSAAAWLLPPLLLFDRTLFGPQAVEVHSRVYELSTANHLQMQSMDELADKLSEFPPRPGGLLIGLYLPGSLPFAYSIQAPLLDTLHPAPRFTYFNATVQVPGHPEPDPDLVISPERFNALEHFGTGTKFKLSQAAGLLYLYVPVTPSTR